MGKMFLPGWSIWCVVLTLRLSACVLEISGYDSHGVICSQGLLHCTMEDETPFSVEDNDTVVQNLSTHFKLCCKDGAQCTLCLVIDTEIVMKDEDYSGHDEEDSDETRNTNASVTVCYNAPNTMPTCKKVEFTVNHEDLTQPNQAKLSMVITEPAHVTFSSQVTVYAMPSQLYQMIAAPSLDEVCSTGLQERVQECHAPRLSCVINQEMNRVELQFGGKNNSLPSMCIQHEQNGRCVKWNRTTIPLDSVTPCMCFMAWEENGQRSVRSLSCPFIKTDFLWQKVWRNVHVSVVPGQMNNNHTMLSWNLSAPCRLVGEVWPCHKGIGCLEDKGFRQQLKNSKWKQNIKGQWEKTGVFEAIDLRHSPCVMVKVEGMTRELGPFCFQPDRGRWSLLVIVVMLLLCLTVLIFYLLHAVVKKWVWSWHHGGFVEIGKRHVVLLSPPDMDNGVSESVCQLGSLLRNQGFSVSVDQWSRKEQCTLGPLPWLHSQLLQLKSQGGRVVLVLTRQALERAEEWTHRCKEITRTKWEDKGLPKMWSPYSDVFMASLCLIEADRQQGRAGERFLLVRFDSHPHSGRRLPQLLQGLPLFHLPSQTQSLLTELTVGRTGRGSRRTWAKWKLSASDGWSTRT